MFLKLIGSEVAQSNTPESLLDVLGLLWVALIAVASV